MRTFENEQRIRRLESIAIPNIPWIKERDNIGKIIFNVMGKASISLGEGDVVVIAQKIVSRAEGRVVPLRDVRVTDKALELSKTSGKDPRLCQLILDDSRQVLYANERTIITEHVTGLVSGSSGIDTVNTGFESEEVAILLPKDADKSARRIRETLRELSNKNIAVIITDSIGRPFRKGSVGMAIGFAGLRALQTVDGPDLWGRKMHQEIALVDEIAAAASPLMGESNEGYPVIVVRGLDFVVDDSRGIKDLIRPPEEDQIWP